MQLERRNKVGEKMIINFQSERPNKWERPKTARMDFPIIFILKGGKMPPEMLVKLKLEKVLREMLRDLWTAEILLNGAPIYE